MPPWESRLSLLIRFQIFPVILILRSSQKIDFFIRNNKDVPISKPKIVTAIEFLMDTAVQSNGTYFYAGKSNLTAAELLL